MNSGGVFDLDHCRERMNAIETELARPGAWDAPERLTPVLREKSALTAKIHSGDKLSAAKNDLAEWLELAKDEAGPDVLDALDGQIAELSTLLADAELAAFFGPADNADAILEIHPGAGGTEAQDWAEMLLRMYRRWAERKQFEFKSLDLLPGDEAGIKSVTVQISGPYAYGLLVPEKGIHRLIRISPFDASGRRHTSFASVDVYPDVTGDITIDINEEDLRIDVFRASGPGGQHVNKTSSAIRITHLPTNIVVQCQDEKSQHRNKETAMKVLRARLYDLELKKIQAEKQESYEAKNAIGFGSQIRTYTLQPYRLVKDHRTGIEAGDVEAVLDGDLDKFIRGYLLRCGHEA